MTEKTKSKRLLQIAKELNVGIEHLVEHLHENNIEVDARPNAKVSYEGYELLLDKFSSDKTIVHTLFVLGAPLRASVVINHRNAASAARSAAICFSYLSPMARSLSLVMMFSPRFSK